MLPIISWFLRQLFSFFPGIPFEQIEDAKILIKNVFFMFIIKMSHKDFKGESRIWTCDFMVMSHMIYQTDLSRQHGWQT
jgi:hypothetical protein